MSSLGLARGLGGRGGHWLPARVLPSRPRSLATGSVPTLPFSPSTHIPSPHPPPQDGQKAAQELDGTNMDGRTISVKLSEDKYGAGGRCALPLSCLAPAPSRLPATSIHRPVYTLPRSPLYVVHTPLDLPGSNRHVAPGYRTWSSPKTNPKP